MRTHFVGPSLFGFVAHYLVYIVVHAYAHHAHNALLKHVGEHLRVVAAGFVAFSHRGIDARLAERADGVAHRELREQLEERLAEVAAVVDIYVVVTKKFGISVGKDVHNAIASVAETVRTETAVLPIAAKSQRESPVAERVFRLVVERKPIVGHGKFAAEQKLARIPHNGVVGVGIVALVLYEIGNAVIVESNGCIHVRVPEKPE